MTIRSGSPGSSAPRPRAPPESVELAELTAALADFRARFQADADAAKQLIAIGETKADPALDPTELASWTMVANTVLNLDEVINKP